jgi:phosphoenolpyruvate synthase/pyruvate phosphate dikinase
MMVRKCVIDAAEATGESADRIGGKAMNLARLQAAGLPVPRFVVVMEAEVGALSQLDAHLSELTEGGCRRLAVRSSFAEEDGESASFAGLLNS